MNGTTDADTQRRNSRVGNGEGHALASLEAHRESVGLLDAVFMSKRRTAHRNEAEESDDKCAHSRRTLVRPCVSRINHISPGVGLRTRSSERRSQPPNAR